VLLSVFTISSPKFISTNLCLKNSFVTFQNIIFNFSALSYYYYYYYYYSTHIYLYYMIKIEHSKFPKCR
jgi:hypothetical protein